MTDQPTSAPETPFDDGFGIRSSSRAPLRRKRSWLGPSLIVGGLVGGAVALVAQRLHYERRISSLERAVAGYTTTLTFERAGTFSFYYEYRGEFLASFDGDEELVTIDAPERRPRIGEVLRDAGGEVVELVASDEDVTYSAGQFEGRIYRQAEIPGPGDYSIEVPRSDQGEEFALAIGIGQIRRPSFALPLIIAALGVLAGLALIWRSRRTKAPSPEPRRDRFQAPGRSPDVGSGAWDSAPQPAPLAPALVPPVAVMPQGSVPPIPPPTGPVALAPPIGTAPTPAPLPPPVAGRPLPPPVWSPPAPPSS